MTYICRQIMKTQIKIFDYLPSTIVTRDSIADIRDLIKKSNYKQVIFNFENIEFVSRAFADELLNLIEENKLDDEFIMVSDEISEVFKIIRKNRYNGNRGYQYITVAKFTNQNQLDRFLALI